MQFTNIILIFSDLLLLACERITAKTHFTQTSFRRAPLYPLLGERGRPALCQNQLTPRLAVTKDDSREFVLIIVILRTLGATSNGFYFN